MSLQAYDKEVRIALVLYGGVSMATYIYGACHELFRLIRAAQGDDESPYKEIVEDLSANVTIDIISGASAGGLNGAALAKALVNGSAFDVLERFWIDEGQIERLMNSPKRRNLESLLDERRYEEQLRRAFDSLEPPGEPTSLVDSMDLFVMTTDLHGRGTVHPTFDGGLVYAKTHERPYSFRYRSDGINDFEEPSSKGPKLWEVCRASSAFPGAFPPKPMRDENQRQRYLSDGGLVNNFPFEEVLQAISARPADVLVDRVLMYIEPDPSFDREAFDRTQRDQDRLPLDNVLLALPSIRSFESISEVLQRLHDHNARVDLHNRSAEEVEAWFRRQYRCSVRNGSLDAETLSGFRNDPLSGAYRAWKRAQVHQLMAKWLLDMNPSLKADEIRLELERLESKDVAAFYRSFDVDFKARRFYYLARELNRLIQRIEADRQNRAEAPAGHSPTRQALFAAFPSRLRGDAHVKHLLRHKRELLQLVSRSREIPSRVRQYLSSQDDLATGDVASILNSARKRFGSMCAEVMEQGNRTLENLDDGLEALGYYGDADEGYVQSRFQVMSDGFELRDAFLFPFMIGSGMGERDYVELAPLSPASESFINVPHKQKLAGEILGHFGGFLKKEWRQNDIMWGRLDSAETMVKLLHQRVPSERRKSVEHYLRPIQKAIVMSSPLAALRLGGQDYKTYLENDYKIGRQGLLDVPPKDLVPLVLNVAALLHGIVETAGIARASTPLVGIAYKGMAKVVGVINTFLNPLASLLFPRSALLKAAVALAMILAVGASAGLLLIHFIGFQTLQPATLILAGLVLLASMNLAGFYYRLTWRKFVVLAAALTVLILAIIIDVRQSIAINDFLG